jgi:hypothetical protein
MIPAARRVIRAVKILARDGRIPKPLRGLVAFGLLPIPGPFDEAVLVIVGLLFWTFYRKPLRQAWTQAAAPNFTKALLSAARDSASALASQRGCVASTKP